MALFDSIISGAAERFGLDNKSAGGLLAALLAFISDPESGGVSGFLNRFRDAGLGGIVDSWIGPGESEELNAQQLEAAIGTENVTRIADDAGIERDKASAAMAGMLPQVVNELSPEGEIDNEGVLSRIGGFLSGWGGAAAGAIGGGIAGVAATASGAADAIGETAGKATDSARNAAGAIGDQASVVQSSVARSFDSDGDGSADSGGVMKWLLPLIILALLVALLFWFCGRGGTSPATNANENANVNSNARSSNMNANRAGADANGEAVDSNFSIRAANGKYTVTGVVQDQETLDNIKTKLDAQFGVGNVDYSGLTVNANAKPFAEGWWANFEQMLPDLKDWKDGSLEFAGNAIRSASGLPAAAVDRLRSLFTGWSLPGFLDPENAAKTANEEAVKALQEASSPEEVVEALNVSIINFASGSSSIPADANAVLDAAAEVMKKQTAGTKIEIGGHTDSDGDDAANMKLSQARADAVLKALTDRGVSAEMLTAKGYGETQPLAGNTNSTDEEKYRNRRIEYKSATGDAPTATTEANTGG